jgi:VWFA-related protein
MTRGVGLALIVCTTAGTALAGQRPVFRSTAESVAVNVSVRQGNTPITDLEAGEFELIDDGVVQEIVDVSRETQPVDVTLIVDLSGSLDGPLLDALKHAIGEVADRLHASDRASLVTFDQHVREVSALSVGGLREAMERIPSPRGLTSLLDAVAVSLLSPTDSARRPMAILFTDGKDVTSFLDEPQLIDVAVRSGVTIFAVAITDGNQRVPHEANNAPLFKALTGETGGVLAVVQRDQNLGASFVTALEDFRTSYVLRYIPSDTDRLGWHELDVKVTRRGRFDLRSRRGYFNAAAPRAP